jgi:hypothetical protein
METNPAHLAATPGRRHQLALRITLAVFLVFGIVVRVRQYVACPSYWYDEAYLLLNVSDRTLGELVGPLDYQVVAPPLYLALLRGLYVAFGSSEWAMRLPALVASLASLFLMIPLARRLAGGPAWVWAVGLCAVSHHALVHSCEVRFYATDFLVSQAILLAAAAALLPDASARARSWGLAGLLAGAALGPWVSLPSPFILSGVSLALLVEAARRRERRLWGAWVLLNLLLVTSSATFWLKVGTHYYYPGLQDHWGQRFIDSSSGAAALAWVVRCLLQVGEYGTTGMGIPLLVLAAAGLVAVGRRCPTAAVVLLAPVLAAMIACALRRYPLGDRLVFFLVPCVWLAATAGIGLVLGSWPGRRAWAAGALLLLLLIPDGLRVGKQLVVVEPKAEYREAFAFVHEHWQPGDRLWVLHSEVYEVYFGKDSAVLGWRSSPDQIRQAAQQGRLWLVLPPQRPGMGWRTEVLGAVKAAPSVAASQKQLTGLEVVLCQPENPVRDKNRL